MARTSHRNPRFSTVRAREDYAASLERLYALAERRRQPFCVLARDAIDEYLARQEPRPAPEPRKCAKRSRTSRSPRKQKAPRP